MKQATLRMSRCCVNSSMVHPRVKQVRILGTDAGDKGTVENQVLLVAQGARGTFHAQALRLRDVVVA